MCSTQTYPCRGTKLFLGNNIQLFSNSVYIFPFHIGRRIQSLFLMLRSLLVFITRTYSHTVYIWKHSTNNSKCILCWVYILMGGGWGGGYFLRPLAATVSRARGGRGWPVKRFLFLDVGELCGGAKTRPISWIKEDHFIETTQRWENGGGGVGDCLYNIHLVSE
jgi:hypothetical protein